VALTFSGNGKIPPSCLAPQMILADRSTSAVLCIAFSIVVPTATIPWLAMSAALRLSRALTTCSASSGEPLAAYSEQRMSPPR